MPTPAGRELRPIIKALGAWGTRWIGELGGQDLDPQLLLWDMPAISTTPRRQGGRTVVQFRFPDLPAKVRDWWLVITPGEADVYDADPGYPVAVTLTATLRHMTQVWRGDLSWPKALRAGTVDVLGPEELRRAAPAGSRSHCSPRCLGSRPRASILEPLAKERRSRSPPSSQLNVRRRAGPKHPAQNALIWRSRDMIAGHKATAPNGGSGRVLLELLDHSL